MSRSKRGRPAILALLPLIPRILRVLGRLARDPRLRGMDRGLALLAVTYLLNPLDLIPDVLGLFGLSDDLFLAGLVLTRLLRVAGPLLAEAWPGGRVGLVRDTLRLRRSGAVVPKAVRGVLRRMVARNTRRLAA